MRPFADLKLRSTRLTWPCYRLIPSRFPPINVFESVADPEDFEALYELESLTNPRLAQEAGKLDLVPPQDRVFGEGSSPLMAAFTHPALEDRRFCPAGQGAYYAARTLDTAIAESRHHRQRYLRAVTEPAGEVSVRCYVADLAKPLLNGRKALTGTDYLSPADYAASVRLGTTIRASGAWGLLYPSVRDPGGECLIAFRPPTIRIPVRQGPHFRYIWDGESITHVVKTELVE